MLFCPLSSYDTLLVDRCRKSARFVFRPSFTSTQQPNIITTLCARLVAFIEQILRGQTNGLPYTLCTINFLDGNNNNSNNNYYCYYNQPRRSLVEKANRSGFAARRFVRYARPPPTPHSTPSRCAGTLRIKGRFRSRLHSSGPPPPKHTTVVAVTAYTLARVIN